MVKPGAFGAIQAGGQLIQGVGDLIGGLFNASIQREQGKILQSRMNHRARMTSIAADFIIEQGEESSAEYMSQIGGLIGKQRMAFAAQNVVVGGGSKGRGSVSSRTERDTRHQAQKDVLKIKSNARNQAFGLRFSAQQDIASGMAARSQSSLAASQTTLGGLSSFGANLLAVGSTVGRSGLLEGINFTGDSVAEPYFTPEESIQKFGYDKIDPVNEIFAKNRL